MGMLMPPSRRDPVIEKDFRFIPVSIPCEWAESYHPGGLHPVHFADVLNIRYRVIRKLGNGSFATVWLALDLTFVPFAATHVVTELTTFLQRTTQYVALKIQAAAMAEINVLGLQSMLLTASQDDKNSQFVVTLLDSFDLEGPNGSHTCLVLEPMGPSVSSVLNAPIENYDPLNPPIRRLVKTRVKRILRQVLRGLHFLHSNGVVHGDLQFGNILFAVQDLNSVDLDSLLQTTENSRVAYLQRKDGNVDLWAPRYLAVGMPLSDYVLSEDVEMVKVIDLGGAFLDRELPQTVITPAALRAPESILGSCIGKGIDIWSFGCLLFEFLTGMPLFQLPPLNGSDECIDDDHLIQLTAIIGPLPKSLSTKWPRATKYYGPNGERLNAQPWPSRSHDDLGFEFDDDFSEMDEDNSGDDTYDTLDQEDIAECGDDFDTSPPKPHDSLETMFNNHKPPDVGAAEAEMILSLLRLIFQYDPSDRPSVADILEHSWFSL